MHLKIKLFGATLIDIPIAHTTVTQTNIGNVIDPKTLVIQNLDADKNNQTK